MSERMKDLGALCILLGLFAGGVMVGSLLSGSPPVTPRYEPPSPPFPFRNVAPYTMTASEQAAESLSAPIPPLDILVRIIPKEQLAITCNDLSALACQQGNDPCIVYFPAEQIVDFQPKEQNAYWQNRHNGDMLAHEFLHCIYGNWHQVYTDHYSPNVPVSGR